MMDELEGKDKKDWVITILVVIIIVILTVWAIQSNRAEQRRCKAGDEIACTELYKGP